MIALIKGEVAVRRPDHVVIDCSGVGYRLAISAYSLQRVPAVGKQVALHTHMVVRDDALNLYGFSCESERELFLSLLSVKSVGPKVALAILSGGTPGELRSALASGDVGRLQAVPGIGKRTAERIIVELREQMSKEEIVGQSSNQNDPYRIAYEGLIGLGYSPTEASGLLATVSAQTPEEMIAEALQKAQPVIA